MVKIKSIIDIDLIYPTEEKLKKFIEKIYETPVNQPKVWEQTIFSFFKEEPFIVYVIRRGEVEEDYETENQIKSEFFGKACGNHILFWDSNAIYKNIIEIRDAIKINPKQLKMYLSFFFMNSILLRRMLKKKVDQEDSGFKDFKSMMLPYSSTFIDKQTNEEKFYQNIYFLLADGSIDFNPKMYIKEIENKFSKELNKRLKAKKLKPKRNPLDSKLRHECFKRDNYKCLECGATKEEKTLHCDHIIPVAQGGSDELDNLQTLCDDCNLAKSDKAWIADNSKGVKNGEKDNQ